MGDCTLTSNLNHDAKPQYKNDQRSISNSLHTLGIHGGQKEYKFQFLYKMKFKEKLNEAIPNIKFILYAWVHEKKKKIKRQKR